MTSSMVFWTICKESSWRINAHTGEGWLPDVVNDTIIDLFAAVTGSTLAMLLYLVEARLEEVSPIPVQRVKFKLDLNLY